MIDARFPPQPTSLEVSLYKSDTREGPDSNRPTTELHQVLSRVLGLGDDRQLLTGKCASSLLRAYTSGLTDLSHETLSIAVPAFSCKSLVDATIGPGSRPVFYDVDHRAEVVSRGVDYAIARGCKMFIWPAFFGTRNRDQQLVARLHEAGIRIVFDEAQANPLDAHDTTDLGPDDILLYSFGKTKMVAGNGGGALVAGKDDSVASQVSRNMVLAEDHTDSNLQLPRVSNTQLAFDRQDLLLENLSPSVYSNSEIDNSSASPAIQWFTDYPAEYQKSHADNYELLSCGVRDFLGYAAMNLLTKVHGTPSICAIQLDPRSRYDCMSRLAEEGIQTTWYYYPISLLSRYRHFDAQPLFGTLDVASSVVVLPFQWKHGRDDIAKVVAALEKIKGNG